MATEPDSHPDKKPAVTDEAAPEAAEEKIESSHDEERREFIAKAGSIVFGGLVVAAPVGAGLVTLVSPMISESAAGKNLFLASIEALPADGTPKRFDVIDEKIDAWVKYPPKPIGGVFLRKVSDTEVVAFNTSCPHAGCSVGFKSELKNFHCPCHDSTFEIDGSRGEVCVSARGLDQLEVDQMKLAENGEVWVTFMNFKAGVSEENKAL